MSAAFNSYADCMLRTAQRERIKAYACRDISEMIPHIRAAGIVSREEYAQRFSVVSVRVSGK